jgi:hypothetical protein
LTQLAVKTGTSYDEFPTDEPLTTHDILDLLEQHGEEFDSAHRVATVLGRQAERSEVEVIRDQPYRYRFRDVNNSAVA